MTSICHKHPVPHGDLILLALGAAFWNITIVPASLFRPRIGVRGIRNRSANMESIINQEEPLSIGALVLYALVATALLSATASERVDFSFSPPEWQTAICLPDDPDKSLVDRSGNCSTNTAKAGVSLPLLSESR